MSRINPQGNQWLAAAGTFVSILVFLSCWAVLKPPFQSPDEFSQLSRVLSIQNYPWTVKDPELVNEPVFALLKGSSEDFNPLFSYPKLRAVPFHTYRQFYAGEFAYMKELPWPKGEPEDQKFESYHHTMPALYFHLVWWLAKPLVSALKLSPYDSFYVYRFVNVFLASLGWMMVYLILGKVEELSRWNRFTLFALAFFNPMLGFISSSVSADALFNPLCNFALICSYLSISKGKHAVSGLCSLMVAGFTKSQILIMYPTIVMSAVFWKVFTKGSARVASAIILLGVGGFVISYFSFYFWVTPYMYGSPLEMSLLEYVMALPARAHQYFIMYFGNLGWLDYQLSNWWYIALALVLLLQTVSFILNHGRRDAKNFPLYSFVFAIIFCTGTIAGEYLYVAKAGLTLQGRYFLPVAIGLSAIAVHRNFFFSLVLLLYLFAFNLAFMQRSIERYYAGGLPTFYESLPFRAPTVKPVGMVATKPVERDIKFRSLDEFSPGPDHAGFIDRIVVNESRIEVEGWVHEADDIEDQVLLVYSPGTIPGVELRSKERSDVVGAFQDPSLLQSGFHLDLIFESPEKAKEIEKNLCFAFQSAQKTAPVRLQFGADAWRCK